MGPSLFQLQSPPWHKDTVGQGQLSMQSPPLLLDHAPGTRIPQLSTQMAKAHFLSPHRPLPWVHYPGADHHPNVATPRTWGWLRSS